MWGQRKLMFLYSIQYKNKNIYYLKKKKTTQEQL